MSIKVDVTQEELEFAYRVAKADRPKRVFVEYPLLIKWAQSDISTWLNDIKDKVAEGYQPHSSRMCWIPKPNYLLRPGNILHFKDEIVYNLIISRLYDKIWDNLNQFQGNTDVSYQLEPPGKKLWFKNNFKAWQSFTDKSLEKLTHNPFVVVSDITGFYENIDIARLLSELRKFTGECSELNLLRTCLRKWSFRGDIGIPQGYSASDMLAKVYAYFIDSSLKNDGYNHLRYVDDIRIFCKTKTEAKKAIMNMSDYMHKIGLNLQSAKTKIITSSEAFTEFSGSKIIIEGIHDDLIEEINALMELGGPYVSTEELAILLKDESGVPLKVIEVAFNDHFTVDTGDKFNKSLFHYLINKLGEAESDIAIDYCLQLIKERPEETDYVLKYLADINCDNAIVDYLIDYISSDHSIYNYQKYQIIKWVYDNAIVTESSLAYVRKCVKDNNCDVWMRCYAIVYLGEHGNSADIDNLESKYADFNTCIEKSHCIHALKKQETGKRNAFYAAVENDDTMIKYAVKYAKLN